MTKSAFTATYDAFRRILIEHRRRAGLTQVELSRKLGKPQSFVSKYERGERRLDVVEFLDVADALALDPLAVLQQLREIRRRPC